MSAAPASPASALSLAPDFFDRSAQDDLLLGVATGKGRRGLDVMVANHGLQRTFVTLQCADDHPSKPHPAMVLAALAEAGVAPADAVMVGDTTFDMEMARAAGVAGLGVGWGYHEPAALSGCGAVDVVADFAALTGWIEDWAR